MSTTKTIHDLILSLPAELRSQIYTYLKPFPPLAIIIRAPYPQLTWLSASRALFDDAAPAIYSRAYFTTYLKLDKPASDLGTITTAFHSHLDLTYGPETPTWLKQDAREMVRFLTVDISTTFPGIEAPGFGEEYISTIPHRTAALANYLTGVMQDFVNLEVLRLCFPDTLTDVGTSLMPKLAEALLWEAKRLGEGLERCKLEVLRKSMGHRNGFLSPVVVR